MAIRNILLDSDPILKKKSRVIADFNKRLHVLIDDMRETLVEANGLGLAAPQVGVLRRVALILDSSIESEDIKSKIVELVNPVILKQSGEQTGREGCLSVPGVCGIVTRPEVVTIQAQDRNGKAFKFTGKEMTARAICHEIDHLDGVLFTTRVERWLTEDEMEEEVE